MPLIMTLHNGTIPMVTGTETTVRGTMLTYSLTILASGSTRMVMELETTLTTLSTMVVNNLILMVTVTVTIQTVQTATNMQMIHFAGLIETVMDIVTRKAMTHSH